MAAEPLNGIKAHASEIGGFMQVVTDQAAQQITLIQAKITELSTQLAQCNNFEDVINMLVNQILQAAGVGGGRFEIDNIRQAWRALGPFIDEKIVWAQTNVVGPGGSVQRAVDEGGRRAGDGPRRAPAGEALTESQAGGRIALPRAYAPGRVHHGSTARLFDPRPRAGAVRLDVG